MDQKTTCSKHSLANKFAKSKGFLFIIKTVIPVSENNSFTDILDENEDKISDEEAQTLEGKITYAELLHALKQMKNEKSPGLDGYTAEFFKIFG